MNIFFSVVFQPLSVGLYKFGSNFIGILKLKNYSALRSQRSYIVAVSYNAKS